MSLQSIRTCIVICLCALSAVIGLRSAAGELRDISIHNNANAVELVLITDGENAPSFIEYSGENPRLVFDFKDTLLTESIQQGLISGAYKNLPYPIIAIRAGIQKNKRLRVVADLSENAKYRDHRFQNGMLHVNVVGTGANSQIIITVPTPSLAPRRRSKTQNSQHYASRDTDMRRTHIEPVLSADGVRVHKASMVTGGPKIPTPRLRPSRAYKPVIVIDPGHGGHDPGAVGAAKNKEADITLQAGLELRRQLLATGRYKVVMTRASNRYVDHDNRVLKARKAGADLFISIHADSTDTKSTRGASVYTLADRALDRSKHIVDSQNWISDVDLQDHSKQVGDILVDLAQRKTRNESARFANLLIPQLQRRTNLLANTHRRAGYYVLLAPDVPAVLLELGFISNRSDEKKLKSAAHREKLMTGVTEAINLYFNQ